MKNIDFRKLHVYAAGSALLIIPAIILYLLQFVFDAPLSTSDKFKFYLQAVIVSFCGLIFIHARIALSLDSKILDQSLMIKGNMISAMKDYISTQKDGPSCAFNIAMRDATKKEYEIALKSLRRLPKYPGKDEDLEFFSNEYKSLFYTSCCQMIRHHGKT